MKPVLYRYRDSESVIEAMEGYTPGEGWTPLYDQAAVDGAVAAERERAAKVKIKLPPTKYGENASSIKFVYQDAFDRGWKAATASMRSAIRALKDKQS